MNARARRRRRAGVDRGPRLVHGAVRLPVQLLCRAQRIQAEKLVSSHQAALATRTSIAAPQEPSIPLNGVSAVQGTTRAGKLNVSRSPAFSAGPETALAASPLDVLAYQLCLG